MKQHPLRIEDYLQHIVEAIDRITGYIQEIDNAAALERDHKTQAAVIRYIEIIGEAATRIQKQAPDIVDAHPLLPWQEMLLPWQEMRRMRNKLIHNYFDVNVDVLWGTVKDDLPKLKQQIDGLLAEQRHGREREKDPSR